METAAVLRGFVLDYLAEIGAAVTETEGVYAAQFPPGRKRRFGRERRFTFDAAKRLEQVELVEPGSPFLKLLLLDAQAWGGLGVAPVADVPAGSRVYTFQFEAYSSLRKRTHFATALLEAGATEPRLSPGIPSFFASAPPQAPAPSEGVRLLKEGLDQVLPRVEAEGRLFAEDSVRESRAEFAKSLGRVQDYFQGMKEETWREEARIRKRLGEIQSKLYFTEDGLRELKLQREQERLLEDLHSLKKKNTEAAQSIQSEHHEHAEKVRRRHEPKLRVRLVAATLTVSPPAGGPPPAAEAGPAVDASGVQ